VLTFEVCVTVNVGNVYSYLLLYKRDAQPTAREHVFSGPWGKLKRQETGREQYLYDR